MKQRILRCDKCGEDTRQLVGKKHSVQNGGKREFHHCTKCNIRTIKSKKNGQYTKNYSNTKR